ncbi:MAG: hypothetical protein ACLPX5_14745 [Dissulfurispiraceae bacterium]
MTKKSVNLGIVFVMAICLALAILSPSGATQPPTQPAPCLYAFEWIHTFRFPLQADPRCAYSYVVVPQISSSGKPVGFLIDADFPYAAWFSWTIYGENAIAVSLASDHDISPDVGSTNPFFDHNLVFAPSRHYRLLLLQEIPPDKPLAPSLADIPDDNRRTIPTKDSATAIAYRVYQAFPNYNLGGSNGPTNTPFPSVYAVNYETGETLDCAEYNAVPPTIGHLPTDTPDVYNLYGTTSAGVSPRLDRQALADSTRLLQIPEFAALQSKVGWQFAPEINPALVTFTRPPLAPGADVSSIPPPDNCAGYLGARVDPRRIALIRIPHVASIFETEALDPNTTFPEDAQAAYISLTMYGASVNIYKPGDPESASLENAEFEQDETQGSTIVVWPRQLPSRERELLFAYAKAQGWVLIRGGLGGPLTTANLLLRLKRANDDYYGAYTPLADKRGGVPCYFEGAAPGAMWSEIEKAADPMLYVASFQNLGNAAPQGVHCVSVAEVLNGECLKRLEAYIEEAGGKYFSPGDVPPP